MAKIIIEGMQFYAYHGSYKHEHQKGNKFEVDIELESNLDKAAETDDINQTVNYENIFLITQKEMEIPSKLLEHVAVRIKNAVIKKFPEAKNLKVRVTKFNPPLPGECEKVSIEF